MTLEVQSRCERARLFCIRNFLPLGFLVALVWALAWPLPGDVISKPEVERYRVIPTINVVIVFLISGLALKTDDIKKAMGKEGRTGYIYGVVSILGITGCLGFLAAEIPFDVEDFSYGLAVFCVVPTSLSSGITLVRNPEHQPQHEQHTRTSPVKLGRLLNTANQAGGNDALALLLTVTTNLFGVVTVPFFVKAVVNAGGAEIDAVDLLVKLIITVLAPLVIGKVFRETVSGTKAWAKRWNICLSLTSNFMIIMIVWQTLSRGQEDLTSVAYDQILSVVAAGVALHVIYLSINYVICRFVLRLDRREFRAVVIMASQKTLPVSVTVVSFLGSVGEEGLMTIPCIIGHISQLFIEAYISSRWAREVESDEDMGILSHPLLDAEDEFVYKEEEPPSS